MKVSDIADNVGIHVSALYYYFDTKEALVTDILAHITKEAAGALHETLDSLPPSSSPVMQLETAIRIYMQKILRQDDYGRAHFHIVQQAPTAVRAKALEIIRTENAVFKQLIEQSFNDGLLRPDIDPKMARMILLGAMNWSVEWFREGTLTIDELADHIILIVLGGMLAAKPA